MESRWVGGGLSLQKPSAVRWAAPRPPSPQRPAQRSAGEVLRARGAAWRRGCAAPPRPGGGARRCRFAARKVFFFLVVVAAAGFIVGEAGGPLASRSPTMLPHPPSPVRFP